MLNLVPRLVLDGPAQVVQLRVAQLPVQLRPQAIALVLRAVQRRLVQDGGVLQLLVVLAAPEETVCPKRGQPLPKAPMGPMARGGAVRSSGALRRKIRRQAPPTHTHSLGPLGGGGHACHNRHYLKNDPLVALITLNTRMQVLS